MTLTVARKKRRATLEVISKVTAAERAQIDRLLRGQAGISTQIRQEFLAAIDRIRATVNVQQIADLIEQGRIAEAMTIINEQATQAGFRPLAQSVVAGAVDIGRAAAVGAGISDATFSFGITNPQTINFLRNYEMGLIRALTDEANTAVRLSILNGVQAGRNPLDVARDVRRFIGLTEYQTQVVMNYRDALRSGAGDALTRSLRDRRFDPTVRASIAGDYTLTEDDINRMVERYADRWLKYRSETIARTEATRATNIGNDQLWRQAIGDGVVDQDSITRHWVYTHDEKTRDAHRSIPDLNPDGVGMDEPFDTELGPLMYPGDPDGEPANTINCRCTVFLRYRNPQGQETEEEQAAKVRKYSEDQPRDDIGRWTDGGGGDAGKIGLPTGTDISSVSMATMRDAVRRNAFDINVKQVNEFYDRTQYVLSITPKDIPKDWRQTSRGDWYDPAYARESEFGGAVPIDLQSSAPNITPEAGIIYRGMSQEEYSQSMERGYFQSIGGHNLSGQEGLSYYSTDPNTAVAYSSGFAPWAYQPTPRRPAVVVAVRDPGHHVVIPGTGENEIGLRGRLGTDAIAHVYFGHPITASASSIDINVSRGRAETGSWAMRGPSLRWESQPVRKYDPDQPRAPAGTAEGGQWTSDGGGDPAKYIDSGKINEASDFALQDYKSMDHLHINSALRDGRDDPRIARIDDAFKESKTTRDIVVYRGVGNAALFNEQVPVGSTFSRPTFQSATLSPKVAQLFGTDRIPESVLLRIHVPKGTPAINMERHAAGLTSFTPVGYDQSEQEILLPRNGTYTVRGYGRDGGWRTVDVEFSHGGVRKAHTSGEDITRFFERIPSEDIVFAKYDPEQPRDDHGRWTDEGGGASTAPSKDKPVVLVFGGSFNPIHTGHIEAITAAENYMRSQGYNVERSLVVPTANRLLGAKLGPKAYPLEERVAMAQLATAGLPNVFATGEPSVEAETYQGKLRRTQLADWARKRYPGRTVIAVAGSDGAPGNPTTAPLVYEGPKGTAHEGYHYLVMPRPTASISSTQIRSALRGEREMPAGAMNPGVHNYLRSMFRRHPGIEKEFNPDQPREPAGSPEGGQWTAGEGGGGGGHKYTVGEKSDYELADAIKDQALEYAIKIGDRYFVADSLSDARAGAREEGLDPHSGEQGRIVDGEFYTDSEISAAQEINYEREAERELSNGDPANDITESSEFTNDELNALTYYKGSGHTEINRDLRERRSNIYIGLIDAALARSTLDHDVEVFRRVGNQELFDRRLPVGSSFSRPTFQSTSLAEGKANDFGNSGSPHDAVTLRIQVPAGTHAINMERGLVEYGDAAYDEGEILLPRNGTYTITGYSVGNVVDVTYSEHSGYNPHADPNQLRFAFARNQDTKFFERIPSSDFRRPDRPA